MLQRMYVAFTDGGIEAILEYIDPEFEAVIPPELSAEPDVYRGHDGLRRWFSGFEGMEDVRLQAERFSEHGEVVLVHAVMHARGSQSGIEVEQRVVQAWTVRDGKAVRVESFPDLDSARQALP
jgi:ketosteroid isomerase-like protein